MDHLQIRLIILVLLFGLGLGIATNIFWNRYMLNRRRSSPQLHRSVEDLLIGYYGNFWNNPSMGLLFIDEEGNLIKIYPFHLKPSTIHSPEQRPKAVYSLLKEA